MVSAVDFCEAADPESKGMVENLVGYAKADLMVPLRMNAAPVAEVAVDVRAANAAAGAWCAEVNANVHSETCAVPAQRLDTERGLLAVVPSLRPEFGAQPTTRKVDKLSCIRFASARYSVPNRLIGRTVTALVEDRTLRVVEPVTGEVLVEHTWWRRVRPASSMTTTAVRVRTNHAGGTSTDPGGEGVPRSGSGRGGVPHWRRRGRGDQAVQRDHRDPGPRGPRTAPSRCWSRWSGRWRSVGGGPPTSDRSWPPTAKHPDHVPPGKPWC